MSVIIVDRVRCSHTANSLTYTRPHTHTPTHTHTHIHSTQQAFRNRFLELNVDDIPGNELVDILVKRVRTLAPPFAECMVNVKAELERFRRGGDIFHGKRGFITPRDLLRWANRNPGEWVHACVRAGVGACASGQ